MRDLARRHTVSRSRLDARKFVELAPGLGHFSMFESWRKLT